MTDRLLERDAVLAELHRDLRSARRGQGRLVLLRGEAGVGKTAVITRFTAELGQRERVLQGWCDALATPRPLGPLIDMLAELSGEPAVRLRAAIEAGDSEAIYAGLLAVFRDNGAWAYVIEDLHWADGATLDLLRFVARRIGALPVLLVVSYRDDEIGPTHPVAALLGDVATQLAVSRIELHPLSATAVAMLATGSGVNADALNRLTGGNPFFVTEVLATGAVALGEGGLPRSVSEAVAGRLARLSVPGRETAYAAAVCGQRAHPALLEAVCPGAAVPECLDAGVLVADVGTVGFRHELARRATVKQIDDYQLRTLHKRVLAVLAEPPIDPNTLAELAFHAENAGDTDAVIDYGSAAAERAELLGANRQAADLYALVLRHAHSIPDELKVTWLERHAITSYLSGPTEDAVFSFRAAIAVRHTLGHRHDEGDNLARLSRLLRLQGRLDEAIDAASASLRLLEDVGPSPQLAWSLINMAHIAALDLDPACARYAARAKALGDSLDDPAVVICSRGYLALAAVFCSDAGWNEFDAARRDAIATPGVEEYAGIFGVFGGLFAVIRGDFDFAERQLTETADFLDDRDFGMFRSLLAGLAALAGLSGDDPARAALSAEQILTRPNLSPQHRIAPLITVALNRARHGESPVWPLLDEALGCAVGGLLRLPVWAARAEAAWLAGDDETVRSAVSESPEIAGAAAGWLAGSLRRWTHLAGDRSPTAVALTTPYDLEINGDWRAAEQEWTRRGCPYDAAIAQLSGDTDAVDHALETFRRLGARPAARRAQRRLTQLRGRNPDPRSHATSTDPHGLTRRQRDVFNLLAVGHSDAEIASALFISPKTANTHVCAIMAKLGVHNRTQAAAYAHPSR